MTLLLKRVSSNQLLVIWFLTSDHVIFVKIVIFAKNGIFSIRVTETGGHKMCFKLSFAIVNDILNCMDKSCMCGIVDLIRVAWSPGRLLRGSVCAQSRMEIDECVYSVGHTCKKSLAPILKVQVLPSHISTHRHTTFKAPKKGKEPISYSIPCIKT